MHRQQLGASIGDPVTDPAPLAAASCTVGERIIAGATGMIRRLMVHGLTAAPRRSVA
jgi:hypothetical protein